MIATGRVAIVIGRFQPYHHGHHVLVEQILQATDDMVLLAVVISGLPEPEATGGVAVKTLAPEHHEPARNPWSAWARVNALRQVWASHADGHRVVVSPTPRLYGPEAWWRFAVQFLPPRRYWVLKWDDDFERAKRAYLDARGEAVIGPFDHHPAVRGRDLRERVLGGTDIAAHVPAAIADMAAGDRTPAPPRDTDQLLAHVERDIAAGLRKVNDPEGVA